MLWFKARGYGWGWTPVTVEGWIVVAAFLVLVLAGVAVLLWKLRAGADPGRAALVFALWIAVLSAVLTGVAWATGGPPHWRWGQG